MHAIMKFRMRRRDCYEFDIPHPLSLDGKYHMFCACENKPEDQWSCKRSPESAAYTNKHV